MKKNSFLLLTITILGFFSFLSGAQEIPVKSKITHVSVFLKGAQITREGTLELPRGKSSLVFRSLPSDMQASSIQVEGKGDFVILSVKHRINYLEKGKDNPPLKALRDKLESYKRSKEDLSVQLEVLVGTQQMLGKNQAIGGNQTGVNVTALANALNFYSKKLTEIKSQQLEISRKLKNLDEKIRQINLQINELTRKQKNSTGEIVVTVSADKALSALFVVNYYTNQAAWRPEYDVRVEDITKKVKINYKAYVKQTTGETWSRIPLTLSTGNPSVGGTKPELSPWYLDFKPPVTLKSYSRKSGAKSAMVSMAEAPAARTAASFTSTVQKQTTTQFEIAEHYTIPSENQEKAVIIKSINLPATYAYYVVPKLNRDAFLVAGISDWSKYDFLSGKMNLFFEGTYAGNSYLNASLAKDTLQLTLGRDKRIKVERKKLVDVTRKQTLGTNLKETHGWKITIKNSKTLPVHLFIEEQIPVSKRTDIVVEPVDISGAHLDKPTGKCIWEVQLKPGESKSFTLKFTVKYPKNQSVYIE